MRPEIDLASVRTDLANARVQLITAQNGYDLAKAQLNQAMGSFGTGPYDIADDDLPAVEGEDTPTESPAEDRMVAAALDRRPEVVSLRLQRHPQVMMGLAGIRIEPQRLLVIGDRLSSFPRIHQGIGRRGASRNRCKVGAVKTILHRNMTCGDVGNHLGNAGSRRLQWERHCRCG